jgi:hypothetical protein
MIFPDKILLCVCRVRRLEDQLAKAHRELENLDKQQLVQSCFFAFLSEPNVPHKFTYLDIRSYTTPFLHGC